MFIFIFQLSTLGTAYYMILSYYLHSSFTFRPRLSVPQFSPDCYTDSDLLLAEDQFPGPTIKAEVGDTVHIKWHNHHPSEGVSIHYHGLLMQDQPYTDGAGGISTCVVGKRYDVLHMNICFR